MTHLLTAAALLPAKGGGGRGGGGRRGGGGGGGGGDVPTIVVIIVLVVLLIVAIWVYLAVRRSRARRANSPDTPPRPDTLAVVPPELHEKNTRRITATSPAATPPPTGGTGPARPEVFHVTAGHTVAVPPPGPRADTDEPATTSPAPPVAPDLSPTALPLPDSPRTEQ